jgi:hypothetical protein
MTKFNKHFQILPNQLTFRMGQMTDNLGSYGLIIEDYVWWMDHERDILNWMADNLPNGIEHQQGAILYFPTDQDRVSFLMRWS